MRQESFRNERQARVLRQIDAKAHVNDEVRPVLDGMGSPLALY